MVNIGVGIEKAKTEFDSVSAYLEDTTTYEEAQTMMLQLSGMNEVNEVYYLDKDTAMAQWKAQEWQDNAYLLDGLVENPLPNSIEVKVTKLEDADRVVEVLNTFNARQKEIEIMKYVGATNWFIRGPFLAEGILIGILSAGISVGITALVYKKVIDMLSLNMSLILGSPMVSVGFMTSNLVFIFMALGVSIGAWGSIISMRRFLDT